MSEVSCPIVALPEGVPYTPEADEYVITPRHSLNDILRWLVSEAGDKDEIHHLLENLE